MLKTAKLFRQNLPTHVEEHHVSLFWLPLCDMPSTSRLALCMWHIQKARVKYKVPRISCLTELYEGRLPTLNNNKFVNRHEGARENEAKKQAYNKQYADKKRIAHFKKIPNILETETDDDDDHRQPQQ